MAQSKGDTKIQIQIILNVAENTKLVFILTRRLFTVNPAEHNELSRLTDLK